MPTTLPIEPRQLAAHACHLAADDPAGEPGDVTRLRRATSAACYAVFHALALAVARQVSGGASAAAQYRLTRAVEHGRSAAVCAWLTDPGTPRQHVAPIVERPRRNAELVAFARAFVDLQRARHAPDYDHLATVDAASAHAACQRAVTALDVLDGLEGTADLRQFLTLVALGAALR